MTRLKILLSICLAAAILAAQAPPAHANEEIAAREKILLDAKADPSDKIKATAFLLGVAEGNQAALEPIKKALREDNPANVIPVLDVLKDDGIRPALLELVVDNLSSNNATIRNAAFNTLASPANIYSDKLNLYQKVIVLVGNKDQSDFARISAIRLLGKIGHPGAMPTLLDILRKETGLKMEIRVELVRALGELKDLGVVEYLISLIDPANKELSRVIVDVLGQITYHNYGLDKAGWEEFWQEKQQQYKPLTREKLLEDFIINLQGELAAGVMEKLESQNLDKIIEIIDYSGGNINPPSKYGKHYPHLVAVAVRKLTAIKIPDDEFPAVINLLNQLLLYDNEEVKKMVLTEYFSSPSARQDKNSIPVLLERYQDKLDPLRMEALAALKNVVNTVVGGDQGKLAPETLIKLEDAMTAALAGDFKTRMNAVDILGFGLRSHSALDRLARLLEFKDAPDGSSEARQFRVKICQNMHHILKTNGKTPLSEDERLKLTEILGRSFLEDDYIRYVVALPLADIGYEKPFKLGEKKYQGTVDLLGSWLKPGSPRNVIEGVLQALEQIKSLRSEQTVLNALADNKVIPPEDSLAVTTLNVLKNIGGNASLKALLKGWTGSNLPAVRNAAWEVVAACSSRLLDDKQYDLLLHYGPAIRETQEADGTPARDAQVKALEALAKAKEDLDKEQKKVTELLPLLDPANAEESKKARAEIEKMAARNRSLRLTLAAGLAGEYAKPIKSVIHELLVKLTSQNIPEDPKAWEKWLKENP